MASRNVFSPGYTARQSGVCETISVEQADPCADAVCPPEAPHCIVENGAAVCVECTNDTHCADPDAVCRNNQCHTPGGNGNGGGEVDPRVLAAGAVVVGGAYWYTRMR